MNTINPLLRVLVLWLILILCMVLHFNYHVSKIFYGINVVRPGTNGTIPFMAQVLKSVYYHIPMIFVVSLLYFKSYWFRLGMFVVTIPYSLSHIAHLREEFMKPALDMAQVPLLSLTLLFSLMLNKATWDYFKNIRLAHV